MFWETIKNFFGDYGYSFLMMVVIGFVIAIITEITVKKAFEWLEAKIGDKMPKAMPFIRMGAIQFATWVQVIAFTRLLVNSMPLPAGKVFYPVWIFLVYIFQFIISCWGIKGILSWMEKKEQRAEARRDMKAKALAEKPVVTKVAGYDNLYQLPDGTLCDKNGRKL